MLKKKNFIIPSDIPEAELLYSPSQKGFLLMGKHGSNVDTMIYLHADEVNRKLSLVSLPRDLAYQGKKINSFYASMGLEAFVRQVEQWIAQPIAHYALVDMYAFRDIVDAMGGIEVRLEQDLIDPTYKTCDHGICSTLYYPAGTHHLNGTQALRVARSRHTSSDFSRSERQQLLLEAIQQKARHLGFGDAKALKKMITITLDALETNISFTEALRFYFRYQHFELQRGAVISTANILESHPEPVDFVTSHLVRENCPAETPVSPKNTPVAELQECEFYVMDNLRPRGDDWNLIPWFIRESLGEI